MNLTRAFLTLAFVFGAIIASASLTVFAALPCNLNDPIDISSPNESTDLEISAARPLQDILQSDEPADREGSREITADDPGALRFNVVSAGENILRCLDYGTDQVFINNTTPEYRESRFEPGDASGSQDLIEHENSAGVYTERVENPLELADGRYLVDFVAAHNSLWLGGEMVFTEIDGDFYLDSSYLNMIMSRDGESHEVLTTNDGLGSAASITVNIGDSVQFENEADENIRISITSDESGQEVFQGNNLGANFEGGAPKYSFFVLDVEPGEYTATIYMVDSDESHEVKITIEP